MGTGIIHSTLIGVKQIKVHYAKLVSENMYFF